MYRKLDSLKGQLMTMMDMVRLQLTKSHKAFLEYDLALVREAEREGVVYLDEMRIERFSDNASHVSLKGMRRGRTIRIKTAFVIDASGPRGFLHNALGLDAAPLRWLPPTQGLYTHFEGVERCAEGS